MLRADAIRHTPMREQERGRERAGSAPAPSLLLQGCNSKAATSSSRLEARGERRVGGATLR
ncbi:hypothetical protein BDW74DRAFT_155749 [Aspergillus multicolor]|uniref:uncharacterized protein n=1 Tax=Aspergillus multicolor TaxID=41759 RepID=UPI003CCDB3DC